MPVNLRKLMESFIYNHSRMHSAVLDFFMKFRSALKQLKNHVKCNI